MLAAVDDYSPRAFIRASPRVTLNGNLNLRHYF
jgi:hypothetical protein